MFMSQILPSVMKLKENVHHLLVLGQYAALIVTAVISIILLQNFYTYAIALAYKLVVA